ncbi:MAG: DUF494 family protein [Bdellovibrionota bacterium]
MDPRIMDAVGYIGQFVSDHWEAMFGQEDISYALQDQGFSSEEITRAFRWIEGHTLGETLEKSATKTGTPRLQPPSRVLGSIEAMKISPRAFGALVSLYERGVLDILQFEEVIERAMKTPGDSVSSRQMKRLAALTLFNRVQNEWRDFLHSKSTLIQ